MESLFSATDLFLLLNLHPLNFEYRGIKIQI